MANNLERLRLDDLAIFLAVLEGGGFRAAAKRLGLSPASVSEKIAQLEAQIGAPMLIRTTRSVTATDAGAALAQRLAPLLAETRAALQDAADSQADVRGQLRLNVTGAVMVDMLPPLLDRFFQRHPHVRVEIIVEDRLVDIVAAGCDAGIRYGEHLAQDMIAVPIGLPSQRVGYAASPAYLAERGTPAHPRDLQTHDAIRLRFSSGAMVPWEFEHGEETVKLDPPGKLTIGVDAAPAAIALAGSGRGVIATFENWLDPHFRSGALVPVLPDWWPRFDGPRLYFSSRLMTAPLRAFVDLVATTRNGA